MSAPNPPAFPLAVPELHVAAHDGMSLRDWFAGQALAGLAQRSMPLSMGDNLDKFLRAQASVAFGLADAMLSARTEGNS